MGEKSAKVKISYIDKMMVRLLQKKRAYIVSGYSWDDPPGVPIYLDGLGGGGGSGTFTVLHSLGDQTTFTPIGLRVQIVEKSRQY